MIICEKRKGGTASIEEKMTENCSRWFGHVQRRLQKASIRRVKWSHSSEKKRKNKNSIGDVAKGDLGLNNILEKLVFNQVEWWHLIHVSNLT